MLTKADTIKSIANDKAYLDMCRKICPENHEDLWQDIIVMLIEYPEEKFNQIRNIKFFVCKLLMNQAHSNTSTHYAKYKHREKFYLSDITHEPYDHSTDRLIDHCLSEMTIYGSENDNNWYRVELFKLYMQEGSIRKLSHKTGIPIMSIQRSLTEFKTDIKSRINENTTHHPIKRSERNKLLEAINATRLSENDQS